MRAVIVSRDVARLIRSGRKTQISWPAEQPCVYRQGRPYALIVRGRRTPVCKITVMAPPVQRELGGIQLRDVVAEGYRTTDEFRDFWLEEHGSWDEAGQVWVMTFALGDLSDRPRLLVARSGTSAGDYTENTVRAMRGEGEAVSATDQEQMTRAAREQEATERDEQWASRRDRLLENVREIRETLPPGVRDSELRGMERLARSLDRKIAAA